MTDRFYATAEWRRLRAVILAQRPVCETLGCNDPATQVDHCTPISRGGARLDPANLIARCATCHSRKTARFDHPDRAASDMPVRAKGCGDDGMPRDPLHHWRSRP